LKRVQLAEILNIEKISTGCGQVAYVPLIISFFAKYPLSQWESTSLANALNQADSFQ